MRKLVLRNIPGSIQRAIKARAREENVSREAAAIDLLRDAEIQRAVEHDMRILESWEFEDEEVF